MFKNIINTSVFRVLRYRLGILCFFLVIRFIRIFIYFIIRLNRVVFFWVRVNFFFDLNEVIFL